MDKKEYEAALEERDHIMAEEKIKAFPLTEKEIEDLKKMELDYAKEILINSRITSYKYKLFRNAMKLNFIGIFMFIIFLINLCLLLQGRNL